MFRKPPSKLETFRDTVADAIGSVQGKLEDLPLDRLKDARDSAGDTVTSSWDVATQKAGEALHSAVEALQAATATVSGVAAHTAGNVAKKASGVAHGATDAASHAASATGTTAADAARYAREAAQHARDAAGAATTTAGTVAGGALEAAAHALSQARDNFAHWAHGAAEAAEAKKDAWAGSAHNAAEEAQDRADAAKKQGKKAAKKAAAQAAAKAAYVAEQAEARKRGGERALQSAAGLVAGKAKAARSRANDTKDDYLAEIVVQDTTSKWLWLGLGLLAGAAIGLMLAPTTGRRSRALLRDKAVKAGHKASGLKQAAAGRAADVSRRASGVIHEKRSGGGEDFADDNTISDRVRTALGENPVTRNLERLNVDTVDGLVTLRGPMADQELQDKIAAVVRAVKGVRDVKLDLLLEDSPEDSEAFVG